MNLIEARKLAREGWVRSPSRTDNCWVRLQGNVWGRESGSTLIFVAGDLDAEDWEPKPKPAKSFDCELLVHDDGSVRVMKPSHDLKSWELCGWRKIRVREVTE